MNKLIMKVTSFLIPTFVTVMMLFLIPRPTILANGDANGDTRVDGLDYVIWLNHYGTTPINGIQDGNFNADNRVDGLDYVIWLNNYGTAIAQPSRTPTPIRTPTPTSDTSGQIYTFIDGPGSSVNTGKDTQMSMSWPERNGGIHPHSQFEVNQRLLLEFDLSTIPASARVIDATLFLYHGYPPERDANVRMYIYSISRENANWIEGTRNIDIAQRGEPTWNSLAGDGAGGVLTPWAGTAGLSTPGVDYEGEHTVVDSSRNCTGTSTGNIGSFMFDFNTPEEYGVAVPLDVNRVQGWIGTNNTNYGMIFRSNCNVGHVALSEYSDVTLRPRLVVRYTL